MYMIYIPSDALSSEMLLLGQSEKSMMKICLIILIQINLLLYYSYQRVEKKLLNRSLKKMFLFQKQRHQFFIKQLTATRLNVFYEFLGIITNNNEPTSIVLMVNGMRVSVPNIFVSEKNPISKIKKKLNKHNIGIMVYASSNSL